MGQRINAKGLRLAVNQQWSTFINVNSNSTKKIIDLRFHVLKSNQLLKKKGFKMVDTFVLNYSNRLVFFLLIQKYKFVKNTSLHKKKRFLSNITAELQLCIKTNKQLKILKEKKKQFFVSKYSKLYLNILSLSFFLSNSLKKKTFIYLYPIKGIGFVNNFLLKKFLIIIQRQYKRYTRFFYFLKAMKLILISIFFNNPAILHQVISSLFQVNKKHSFILKFVENILQFLLVRWSNLLLIGLKLQISGKLNGRRRKQKKRIQLGLNPLQTLSIKTNYSLGTSHTKFGSFGIGVWFFRR